MVVVGAYARKGSAEYLSVIVMAGKSFVSQRGIVMDMARGKTTPLHKQHLYAQEHDAHP